MATDPWGVTVERVELKDVRVPEQLMRAMAAEAEAAREARAKVIAAEGEHKASRALKHAAEVIGESTAALQVGRHSPVGPKSGFPKVLPGVVTRADRTVWAPDWGRIHSPYCCQLRYLQTLASISAEHNSTLVFPVPVDVVAPFLQPRQPA